MPHRKNNPREQFEAVEEMLTRWLRERRKILGSYTEIVVTLDGKPDSEALRRRQQRLCKLLVDYVCAGHFEVFHQLVDEAESFADGSGSIADRLIPAIGDTTEVILAYEEKYGGVDGDAKEKLKRDLSALGEVLESRFVLEDQLIAGLHNRHRRLVNDRTRLA
ncbi:MAG: Rsd/AlgQ family anti-sigma factor [Halioglobus sp.]|nr:Rsd/AlgQ family anti-sigma factor [Halioglobus sp.]